MWKNSTGPLAKISREALLLIENGNSKSTQTTYKTAIKAFESFCIQYDIDPMYPISLESLVLFMGHLSIKKKAPSTILTYVAGITHLININNWVDITKNCVIKKMLSALNRAKLGDARQPVTPLILHKLCSFSRVVCQTQYEAMLFNTAFLLDFTCFLRVSEFTVDSVTYGPSHEKVIRLQDVTFDAQGNMLVYIRFSKTDQLGKGVTLLVSESDEFSFCAVKTLKQYLGQRPSCQGPLLVHFDTSPLTRHQFNTVLQRILVVAGINDNIKSHSFRIGAATYCHAKGVEDAELKRMARWSESSNAHQIYIRIPAISMFGN